MVAWQDDPRLLPVDDEPDPNELSEDDLVRIAELQRQAKVLANVVTFFDSEVWQTIRELSERDRRNLDVKLTREQDAAQWKFFRGQAVVHDWIAALPELFDRKARQVDRALRTLQGEAPDNEEGSL